MRLVTFDKQLIIDFFTKGNKRSINAKKNIAASFIIKGANILINLLIIPLTISYIDPTRYGIWMTLSSLVAWFGFFDIGLGQGLRNRFAEALARGEHYKAKVYVSTTYAILSILIFSIIIIFLIANRFLNWNHILNANTLIVQNQELSILAAVVFTFFCISFVLKLITTVLTADQKPALAAFFDMLGRLLSLIIIFILTKTTDGSLLYLGIVYSIMPVIVLSTSSIFFFNGRYRQYRPSFKNIDFKQAPQLLNIGIKFFVIQITAIIFYQTNTIIIAHMFKPDDVTVYTITYQYFNVIASVFSILLTPYWSAFTEAYVKKDYDWIRKSMFSLKFIALAMLILIITALLLNKQIFNIWIGNNVKANFGLSLVISIYFGLSMFNSVNCQFFNGVGKIKIQLYIAIFFSFIHIPLAILFCSQFGIIGIMFSPILNTIITLGIYEIQYQKIISNKAKGIWDK